MILCKTKTRQDNTRQDKTHTLCEPAQSKCIPTCHKKHFIWKFAGKMLQARMSPERRHKLCASLRSRNASQHFTRGTLYGNLQKNAAAQLDPRSATRTVCEPAQSKCTSTFQKSNFIRKFTGKMPKVRTSPQRGHTFCASLRSRSARQHAGRAASYGNLQGKCRGPAGATTLCVSLKCTSTFKKSHFIQKFTGTMPQTRINPERGHTFCASLRSGNARQHFTRGTFYENLQEKCCGPAGAP